MSVKIAPSLLSCDFSKLAVESENIIREGADWLHVDVMDGHFVPNLTFGMPVVSCLHKAVPEAYLDCHFMVSHPEDFVATAAKAGCSMFTFHIESFFGKHTDPHMLHNFNKNKGTCAVSYEEIQTSPKFMDEIEKAQEESLKLIKIIKDAGMKASISIKPDTPTEILTDALLKELDMVLLMSVEPGFGGQKYKPFCAEKAPTLRKRANNLGNSRMLIEIDGGVSDSSMNHLNGKYIDVFVAGSYVFGARDRAGAITTLRKGLEGESL